MPAAEAAERIACLVEDSTPSTKALIEATRGYLQSVSEGRIVLEAMTQQAAESLAAAGELHAAVVPSYLAARWERLYGTRALSASRSALAPDPAHAAGYLIFSASPLRRSFADLSGQKIFVSASGDFAAFFLREEARRRSPGSVLPDFSLGAVPLRDAEEMLRASAAAVRSGEAAAAAVPVCELEAAQLTLPADLFVVGELPHPGVACRTSTQLIPNQMLVRFPGASDAWSGYLAAAFLAMPEERAGGWGPPPSLLPLCELLDNPDAPASLTTHPWDWSRFIEQYRFALLSLGIVLLLLLIHGVILEKLVKRRTASLVKTMNEKERLEKQRAEAQRKFDALEKAGIVGELSSMVAHELKQPLTVIGSYSSGAQRMLARGTLTEARLEEALGQIASAGADAAAIIDRVRSYAKNPRRAMKPIAAKPFIQSIVDKFSATSTASGVKLRCIVSAGVDERTQIEGDALEVHLAVRNLLKNACEAAKSAGSRSGERSAEPEVTLEMAMTRGGFAVSVRDNGPKLPPDAVSRIGEPLRSTKPDGLGLGLTMVRRIAENHSALFTLQPLPDGGLAATLVFPSAANEESS